MNKLLATCLLALSSLSFAGQDCGEKPPATPLALEQGKALGERVQRQIESSGAVMAFVSRVGVNLSEYGLRYSHMGVATLDAVRREWIIHHLFNTCGTDGSRILTQPLTRFFETDLSAYDALILIPNADLQAKLRTTFLHPQSANLMHHKAYNMIAHPFNTRFQNSNQWVLETTVMGLSQSAIGSRLAAQNWLKANKFEPTGLKISNTKRSAARLFSAHVSFADHTEEEYQAQSYQVVTVDAIQKFLISQDTLLQSVVVR